MHSNSFHSYNDQPQLQTDLNQSQQNNTNKGGQRQKKQPHWVSQVHTHYKVGATHKLINELHTMMMDIPLRTGLSYKQWKKGINVMLEKIAGNCEVAKLQIILHFEANFNQLNIFIGKEMMYQVEENGLIAGKQYESQHGKSAIIQSLNKRLAFNLIW